MCPPDLPVYIARTCRCGVACAFNVINYVIPLPGYNSSSFVINFGAGSSLMYNSRLIRTLWNSNMAQEIRNRSRGTGERGRSSSISTKHLVRRALNRRKPLWFRVKSQLKWINAQIIDRMKSLLRWILRRRTILCILVTLLGVLSISWLDMRWVWIWYCWPDTINCKFCDLGQNCVATMLHSAILS